MNKKLCVLGIGEVLWDMLPDGKRCGGAPANVVYHLNKLGTPAYIVSAVGNDAAGDELLSFLHSQNIPSDFICRNDFKTGIVDVTVTDGIPQYEIKYPAAWDIIDISPSLIQKLSNVSAIIFGTLAQRHEYSRKNIFKIIENLPDDCLKIFDINLRQDFYNENIICKSLEIADILKINNEELTVIAEMLEITGDKKNILAILKNRFNLQAIILTMGAEGSIFYNGDIFISQPVIPCQVVDTVGCGDAFLAGWCNAVLNGQSAKKAMYAGSELSSRIASQIGAM